jgi:hypothetical protein
MSTVQVWRSIHVALHLMAQIGTDCRQSLW